MSRYTLRACSARRSVLLDCVGSEDSRFRNQSRTASRQQRPRAVRVSGHRATLTGAVERDGPDVDLEVYSFLMIEPNALTAINHESMPVLLSGESKFETWLSGSPAEAFALARSFDPAKMRIVQSGLEKKDLLAAA